jgi:NAD(P)-dependent dehydrogenase (short-subunit alcohol dehydrogenase family)
MSGRFENQVVLIFGGSSGIGKSTAAAVFRDGGIPWLIGRTEAKLQAVKKEIGAHAPDRIRVTAIDVLSEESLRTFFNSLPVGSFHHMVLTVGESAKCIDIRGEEGFSGLRMQFDLKFFAQIAPISYGVDKLADGGSIVLTSGAFSRRPGVGSTALSTANAALEAIVKVSFCR